MLALRVISIQSDGQISVIGLLMWRLIDHHKKQDSALLPYPCRSDSSVHHKLDSKIIKNSNAYVCIESRPTIVQTAPEKVKKFFFSPQTLKYLVQPNFCLNIQQFVQIDSSMSSGYCIKNQDIQILMNNLNLK